MAFSDHGLKQGLALPDRSASIRSLARVNKRFHQILGAEACRDISISGWGVPWKVVSLLRLVRDKPLLRDSVRRLTLLLDAGTYDNPCITCDDLPLIELMAAEAQMPDVIWNETETPVGGFINGERVCAIRDLKRFRRPSEAVLQFAPEVILLLILPRLEDLTLCVSAEHLEDIYNVFLRSPLELLALESLTLKRLACGNALRPGDREVKPGLVESLLELAPGVTDLFIRDFHFPYGLYPTSLTSDGVCPESLTTLALHNVDWLNYRRLRETIEGCKNLTKFAYRNRHPDISPDSMVEELSLRASTLQTIWMDFNIVEDIENWDEREEGLITTLEKFRKLENLWVDIGSFSLERVFDWEASMECTLEDSDGEELIPDEYPDLDPDLDSLWGNPP
ncbi:hypothetical protein CSOJ01_14591, partial [Colletotrichum sojae]